MIAQRAQAASLLCLLSATGVCQADEIKVARGAQIVGCVWDEGADELTFNIYRTAIRQVEHGTQRLPTKSVKQVVRDPDPYRGFWKQAEALANGTADEWHRLGVEASGNKLRVLARRAFVEALVRDSTHAAALAALDAQGKKILASDPRANVALRDQILAILASPGFADRQAAFAKLAPLGCDLPFHYLERVRRSANESRGRVEDQLLTLRGDQLRGTYTLFVPGSYDPLTPTPLLVALHGGGPGGKDGKAVRGSGTSAMGFYEEGAGKHGYIVVCPTARTTPWSAPENDGFLIAVVEEITLLFNVDRNRIYLTGHSMGGYGAWHYGAKYAQLWAAVAPMAGGGGEDLQKFRDSLTGVYLYHGTNDEVVSPDRDREAAERMRTENMDFAYAEMPDSGHGFPPEVAEEMWRFFACRRLAVPAARSGKGKFVVTEEPASSFLDKPGKDEATWFGTPGKDPTAEDRDISSLLRGLRRGGGSAPRAAAKLVALGDPEAVAKLNPMVADQSLPVDARRFAAEVLGRLGDSRAAKALQKGLTDPELVVIAASAGALGTVRDSDTAKQFAACVADLKKRMAATMVGSRIDFTDYRAHLATVTRLADAVAQLADQELGRVVTQLADDFLLPQYDVVSSDRTGEDPAAPRRHLATSVLSACRALPGSATRSLLETLANRDDLGVAAEAKALLANER